MLTRIVVVAMQRILRFRLLFVYSPVYFLRLPADPLADGSADRLVVQRLPVGNDGGMRYDVVVIGSGFGFGGSVAALRLAEKGYSVLVLEAGRRFADHELPRTSWRVRRFLWMPALGCCR
ncbi:FAD binding domain-containing protein [Micromonospora sp. Llam0]|nr:FAD binding domain-containing protein [Micromonospora sp. Llam0]